ncbi:E3 ubiquitin-protein ligase HECTD3-like [Salarias fasciatus]|uniref:E3 ubiquitin-protein ligase HECTD3-like n=1 Tax=Salarias fasciatus TaxID=181472 RepID=UPI001176E01C|nr:E3 ubiquitin-protein ligase HECTD3-like [Salarias fasciatus]
MSLSNNPHYLLGRIRFLNRCIESLGKGESVPECLCYVPKEECYKICKDSSSASASCGASTGSIGTLISVYESPHHPPNSKKLCKYNLELKKGTCIQTTGETYCNDQGLWVKISQEQLEEQRPGQELEEGWILVCKHTEGGDSLVPVESPETISRQQQLLGFDHKPCNRWEQVVDVVENALYKTNKPQIAVCDGAAVQKLRYVPPGWTFECDEDLVHYLYDQKEKEDVMQKCGEHILGCLKDSVRSIGVSSNETYYGPRCMTDEDADTYWESAGKRGEHWIRLEMRRGVVVKKMMLSVNVEDGDFMPKKITIHGGGKHLKKLNEVEVDETVTGEVCVLQDMTCHFPVIEIRIEECVDDGTDVRIRGLSITPYRDNDLGLNADKFRSSKLVRYPRLLSVPPDVLYHRALLIQRFVHLLDSVLPYLVPAWNFSLGDFSKIKSAKQFLLLSKHRAELIAQSLQDSETPEPSETPTVMLNRFLAMAHRENPSLDSSCRKSLFNQMYGALKGSAKLKKTLNYRWPSTYYQWWRCDFIGEGIIDHGGGFRDSLTDISEELCPSSAESPVPLPFFIRTSNQDASDAKDYYVPNPACKEFHKYEWIGQLMGCALRGKNFLVLALPSLVWKQLTGEPVVWSKDFPAVDSVLVNLLEAMENMDQETFEFRFGEELVYTTLLTDGQMVELIPGGSNVSVHYKDRSQFICLVQKARLEESKQQIAALRAGLLKVVPQAVLDLLTWQEVEKKVCGDPEITVEALKLSAQFGRQQQNDQRVQYLWEALTNFTNEDRSRFLKFVTGRSRLPAPFCVYFERVSSPTNDELPRASTCTSTVDLPKYTSAKACEEKLRFAVYNCMSIDTDRG